MRWYRINQDQSEFFPELDIRLWGEFHQGCELRVCKFRAASGRPGPSACLQKGSQAEPNKNKSWKWREHGRPRASTREKAKRETERDQRHQALVSGPVVCSIL